MQRTKEKKVTELENMIDLLWTDASFLVNAITEKNAERTWKALKN